MILKNDYMFNAKCNKQCECEITKDMTKCPSAV